MGGGVAYAYVRCSTVQQNNTIISVYFHKIIIEIKSRVQSSSIITVDYHTRKTIVPTAAINILIGKNKKNIIKKTYRRYRANPNAIPFQI